ncbi:D-alanyl-D-alanine carboxypeptidase [Chryseobacterium daecheongense]|uniref:D-alanyl-D-alanine carboxypeptidase n=2 Tax=Chryseobacterium daecheongense TaxID=192389 RepID=A0ABY2FXX2_9FLAO|nr:D-alanyl-D-alanine carboxypeptidase [Chryseobacterium daecheongense]
MSMFSKLFFSVSVTAFSLGFAQHINTQKLNDYFKALDENHKVMGSFAIADKGKIIYTNAVGFADVESKKKADINTVYRIGSITKTFTAVLVMKAVEDKKLALDTKLSYFFPKVENADKITISDLLSHRSGIRSYTDNPLYSVYYTQPITKEKLVEIIEKAGSDFEPGSQFTYSNSNYTLLAYILEKVYKSSYSELVNTFIAQPLHLKYTKVGGKIDSSKNNAHSYAYEGNTYIKSPETDMSVPGGAGAIVSTPSELIAFMNGLISGKLISNNSFKTMKQFKDGYGFGLFEMPLNDKKGIGHNGSIDGFQSGLFYVADGEKTFSMITNQSGYDHQNIFNTLASAAYGKDITIPTFEVVTLSEEELQPLVGTYVTKEMPLKFNIFIKNKTLMAQATGQGEFPLEATSKTSFKFDMAGITIDFDPAKKLFVIKQGSDATTFTKE